MCYGQPVSGITYGLRPSFDLVYTLMPADATPFVVAELIERRGQSIRHLIFLGLRSINVGSINEAVEINRCRLMSGKGEYWCFYCVKVCCGQSVSGVVAGIKLINREKRIHTVYVWSTSTLDTVYTPTSADTMPVIVSKLVEWRDRFDRHIWHSVV